MTLPVHVGISLFSAHIMQIDLTVEIQCETTSGTGNLSLRLPDREQRSSSSATLLKLRTAFQPVHEDGALITRLQPGDGSGMRRTMRIVSTASLRYNALEAYGIKIGSLRRS